MSMQQPGTQQAEGIAYEQGGTGVQAMGLRLRDVETPEQQVAVEDVADAIQVCEWCADQCIQEADPGMVECIQECRDVSDLGRTVLALLPRTSPHAQLTVQAFEQAAQACAQECSRHPHGHCQECATVLDRAVGSVRDYLATVGGGGGTTQGAGGVQSAQQGIRSQGIQSQGVQSQGMTGTTQSATGTAQQPQPTGTPQQAGQSFGPL